MNWHVSLPSWRRHRAAQEAVTALWRWWSPSSCRFTSCNSIDCKIYFAQVIWRTWKEDVSILFYLILDEVDKVGDGILPMAYHLKYSRWCHNFDKVLHNPIQCISWWPWHQDHKQIWREILSRMLYPGLFARCLLKMDHQWQPEKCLIFRLQTSYIWREQSATWLAGLI